MSADAQRRAYVATDVSNAQVAGYYTLAAAGIPLGGYAAGSCQAAAALSVRSSSTAWPTGGGYGLSRTQARQRLIMGCHSAIAAIGNRRFRSGR